MDEMAELLIMVKRFGRKMQVRDQLTGTMVDATEAQMVEFLYFKKQASSLASVALKCNPDLADLTREEMLES